MSPEIRAAISSDQRRVVELLLRQLGEHSLCPPEEVLEAAVARLLSRPDLGRILLGIVEGETVGLAAMSFAFALEHGGRSAWLDELYVEPAHRERGLGTALLRGVHVLASAEGARALELEVEPGHEEASRLYEHHGFIRHRRQRWFLPLASQSAATMPQSAATSEASNRPDGSSNRDHGSTNRVDGAPDAGPPFTGGCLCSAIRYRVTAAAFDVSHCHCTLCRRSTGAPFVTWVTFPLSSLTFVSGQPAERRATPRAARGFCSQCGTALTFREEARPNSIDVTVGSLDTPEHIVPRDHTYAATKLPWIRLDDGLPQFAGVNPAETDCL